MLDVSGYLRSVRDEMERCAQALIRPPEDALDRFDTRIAMLVACHVLTVSESKVVREAVRAWGITRDAPLAQLAQALSAGRLSLDELKVTAEYSFAMVAALMTASGATSRAHLGALAEDKALTNAVVIEACRLAA